MEFLLSQGPRSGPRMTWENTTPYIRILHDCHDWVSMEVTMVAGQRTMKQSKIDLANTRDYHQARILGQLAAMEGKAWTLAFENAKAPVPQARGQGYTRRADRYFVQKAVGTPTPEPTLHALRPASLEDYHSAWELSEAEYESEESEGSGTDSTGYSSTTTATSHHDTDHTQCSNTKNWDRKRWKQKHHDRWEGRKTNAKKQRDRRSGWVVLPLFRESTKEGALTYADWRGEVEEYIMKGTQDRRSRTWCSPPWKERPRETTRHVIRRVTWHPKRS